MENSGRRSAGGVALALGVLLLAPQASARGRGTPPAAGPRIVAHPLVVNEAAPGEVRELQKYWGDLLHHVLKVQTVEEPKVRAALEKEKAGRCFPNEPACLSRLAKAAGGQRAVLVSVNLYPVVVSGAMGTPEQAMAAPRTEVVDRGEIKKGRLRAAKKAIEQVARLLLQGATEDLFAAPPAKPVAEEPPTPEVAEQDFVPAKVNPPLQPVLTPEAPPVAVAERTGGGAGKPLGYGLMGVGLAGLGAGAVLYLQSQDSVRRFQAQVDEGTQAGSVDLEALRALQRQAASRRTWSAVLLGVGAASAVTGTVVLLKSGGDEVEPSLALSVGPEGAQVSGRFP